MKPRIMLICGRWSVWSTPGYMPDATPYQWRNLATQWAHKRNMEEGRL